MRTENKYVYKGQEYYLFEDQNDDGKNYAEIVNENKKVVFNGQYFNMSLVNKFENPNMTNGIVRIPTLYSPFNIGERNSLIAVYCSNPNYCFQCIRGAIYLYVRIRELSGTTIGGLASGTTSYITAYTYAFWEHPVESGFSIKNAANETIFNANQKYARIVLTDNGYPLGMGLQRTFSHDIALVVGAPRTFKYAGASGASWFYTFPDTRTFKIVQDGDAENFVSTDGFTPSLVLNVQNH